jgi:hypothetical protein
MGATHLLLNPVTRYTEQQVREQLEEMVAMGATHLLLNPVTRYTEQVEALAEAAGLS